MNAAARLFFAIATSAFLLPTSAEATILRVPDEYAVINDAMDNAAAGDTVLVAPGTYLGGDDDGIMSIRMAPLVTLLSEAGSAATTLRLGAGAAHGQSVINAEGLPLGETVIEGFLIQEPASGGSGVYATALTWGNPGPLILRDCHFREIDTGRSVGAGVYADNLNVELIGCEFVRCVATYGGAAYLSDGGLTAIDCLVEECDGGGFRVAAQGHTFDGGLSLFATTTFRNNVGTALDVSGSQPQIRNCVFQGNVSAEGPGAVSVFVRDDPGTLRRCLFSGNEGEYGAVLWLAAGTIRQNTFVENRGRTVSALLIANDGDVSVRRNVFAANSGSLPVRLGSSVLVDGGCNLFWKHDLVPDNSTSFDLYELHPTDFFSDPQFCNPEAGDFAVSASSPCLPENNTSACGSIGALGVGCASNLTVMALRTLPPNLEVFGDQVSETAPALHGWPPGSSHVISCTPSDLSQPGARHLFDSWSDGGTIEHSVTAPASFLELTATYRSTFLLQVSADEGGSVDEAGGWFDDGSTPLLHATADSGWAFSAWTGTGDGSYAGPDNPATIQMNGPISQVAHFIPLQDDLTMLVQGSGTGSVSPSSGPQNRGSYVTIEAFPEAGHEFVAWIGQGNVAYSGTDNPATIWMNGPITQIAVLRDLTPELTMDVEPLGATLPETGPQPLGAAVTIEALPSPGYAFSEWIGTGNGSYSGTDNPTTVTMAEPLAQTAHFLPLLDMVATTGGSVTPETGAHTPGAEINIEAVPDARHVFAEWRGAGDGSYTGPSAQATVTVDGPTTQVAHFTPITYEVTLSLSDTDPHASTGSPIGLGKVYLWLVCGTDGISALEAEITGSLETVVFAPSAGILNAGDHRRLSLISANCITGPALLGEFTVLPPGDGTLCLRADGSNTSLTVTNCALPGAEFTWPDDIHFTGVSTNGTAPCDFGRGCDSEVLTGSTPVGVVQAARLPTSDALEAVSPNPFLTETSIRFALRQSSRVQLTVFDVTGRRVRTLVNGLHGAGAHTVTWNGRNDAGRELPAAVYFVRLETGEFTGTKKLILLGRR